MKAARARKKPELSVDAITDAALALVDLEGLDALSMRKLGAALGVEGMALYWYFENKDALLDALVERLMRDVVSTLADEPRDWVGTLREVARAYRRIAHTHPRAFPLLATRRFSSDGTFTFLERLFELARAQGIDDETSARFYRVVSSYCSGFALNELAPPASSAALRRKYPRVAAVSAHLGPEHLEEIFEFGLELQLAALARLRKVR